MNQTIGSFAGPLRVSVRLTADRGICSRSSIAHGRRALTSPSARHASDMWPGRCCEPPALLAERAPSSTRQGCTAVHRLRQPMLVVEPGQTTHPDCEQN
jgi:hypothetical protein